MKETIRNFFGFVWELFKVAIIALILVGFVRYFIFQPFFVRGASMEPNFDDGQYLIVDELSYFFRAPERGEVVIFKYPLSPRDYYIKRIVGLPEETIEIKSGKVTIYNEKNPGGLTLNETYLPGELETDGDIKRKLNSDEYFVLGDNRPSSSDSRRWGALPRNNLVGRVFVRVWPLDAFTLFNQALAY